MFFPQITFLYPIRDLRFTFDISVRSLSGPSLVVNLEEVLGDDPGKSRLRKTRDSLRRDLGQSSLSLSDQLNRISYTGRERIPFHPGWFRRSSSPLRPSKDFVLPPRQCFSVPVPSGRPFYYQHMIRIQD